MGAGDATYDEWAEIHVFFRSAPSEAARAAIEAGLPAPLADSIVWDGEHLMVASGASARDAIDACYPDTGEPGLNTDIETWLHHAHRTQPIVAAVRHEDEAAGGTKLSPWHEWSVHQTDRLLPIIERALERGVDDARAHAARGILDMLRDGGVFLPRRVRALVDPGAGIRAALDAGDAGALIAQLDAKEDALEHLEDELCLRHPKHRTALLGALDSLLSHADLPGGLALELARAVLSLPKAERETTRAHRHRLVADMLAYLGFEAIEAGLWLEAIAAFDLVIESPHLDRTAYNNALFAIMADNNKLPIDRPRALRFLAAALRFGAENPAIFYNSACVYMELGEVERTLECLAQARRHGHTSPETLRDEPLFRPLADDPRFKALFADLPL